MKIWSAYQQTSVSFLSNAGFYKSMIYASGINRHKVFISVLKFCIDLEQRAFESSRESIMFFIAPQELQDELSDST